jgi:hypothetical protein
MKEIAFLIKGLSYLRDRLKEPGTMRSLIWSLLGVAGLDRNDTAVTHYALVACVVLGLVSAILPERKS